MIPKEFVAVDWSGRLDGEKKSIWTAKIDAEGVQLSNGRSRKQTIEHLIRLAQIQPATVVGLDFAFGLPRWFTQQLELNTPDQLFEHFSYEKCEAILSGSQHSEHFWGRSNNRKRPSHLHPSEGRHLRATEIDCASREAQPKSVFQIFGAGAVGTGTLRGLPFISDMRKAGFSVWPFEAPRLPLLIEIYPRVLTGIVQKSSPHARREYLRNFYSDLPAEITNDASASEDAFDALVSALVMSANAESFAALTVSRPEFSLLEGEIWRPRGGW